MINSDAPIYRIKKVLKDNDRWMSASEIKTYVDARSSEYVSYLIRAGGEDVGIEIRKGNPNKYRLTGKSKLDELSSNILLYIMKNKTVKASIISKEFGIGNATTTSKLINVLMMDYSITRTMDDDHRYLYTWNGDGID